MTAKQLNQGYQYTKHNNNIDISIYKDDGVYIVSGFCKQANVVTYEGRFTHKNTLYHCGTHQTVRSAQIAVDRKRIE